MDLTQFLWGGLFSGGEPGGLIVNIVLSAFGLVAGAVIGVPLGIFRAYSPFWLRAPVAGVLSILRATPLLLLVLWTFLLVQVVLAIDLAPVWIGCISLALYGLTHISDIIRSGAKAVPESQLRAARAMALSRVSIALHVAAPIAIRTMIPALTTFATTLFKDSSMCYVIGVVELMQIGVFAATRDPGSLLIYYALVAALFLVFGATGTHFAARLERRMKIRGTV